MAQLLPHTPLADEANFKRGLALLSAGDVSGSEASWEGLQSEGWKARATLHYVDAAFEAGQHREVIAHLRELLQVSSLREPVIDRWAEYTTRLCPRDIGALPTYLELRTAYFSEHLESASAMAAAKVAMGHWEEVVERFSEQHIPLVEACNSLGKFELIAERYSSVQWISDFAHLNLDCTLDIPGPSAGVGRLLRGDISGALKDGPWTEALLAAGQYENVLALDYLDPEDRGAAFRGMGNLDEAVALGDARSLAAVDAGSEYLSASLRLPERLYLLHHLAFRELIAGNLEGYAAYRNEASSVPCGALWVDVWLHRHVMFPLADRWIRTTTSSESELRMASTVHAHKWHGKLRNLSLFIVGDVSLEEFTAQPCKLFIQARTILAQAFRAEYLEDVDAARTHYRRYLELPPIERKSDSARGDPIVEHWATFRARD